MALSNTLVLVVVTLLAALIQGIGSAAAPLVSAAIEAHKEKMPSF
jgi:Na+-transporting methylmalonyl-CoA/oxaloacetate decarboxylase gamma subunit